MQILCNVARAVARSENPGGLVVMGGDNVPPLVEIGFVTEATQFCVTAGSTPI